MQNSRRSFIGQLGAVLLAGPAVMSTLPGEAAQNRPAGEGKGLVGSNIYGWGQYAQRENRKLDIDEVISALRDCGYNYLENFMDLIHPEENGAFAAKLRSKGLQPVSLYTGARLHEADKTGEVIAKVLAAAKMAHEAGFTVLSCNADPIGREKTEAELKTQARALTELGQGLTAIRNEVGHAPSHA